MLRDRKHTFLWLFLLSTFCVFGQKEPSNDSTLVQLVLYNLHEKPVYNAELHFMVRPGNEEFTALTDFDGKAEILIPKIGQEYYEINMQFREEHFQFNKKFKIPQESGAFVLALKLRYESKHQILDKVSFVSDEAVLLPESHAELNRIVELMGLKQNMMVEVSGYSHNIGEATYNTNLSQRRADVVKQYLVKSGIAENRIQAMGYGPQFPIASDETEEGKLANTRVELKILQE